MRRQAQPLGSMGEIVNRNLTKPDSRLKRKRCKWCIATSRMLILRKRSGGGSEA
jgi:hypothetical protein